MKINLKGFMISGIIFVWIAGVVFHFVYELSGENKFVGLFAAINESTWEHMKLIFFPMLAYSIFGILMLDSQFKNATAAFLSGTLLATFMIPVLFYTYSGILGYNKPVFDISVFLISAVIGFLLSYIMMTKNIGGKFTNLLIIACVAMTIAFFAFTYYPLKLGIFKEP